MTWSLGEVETLCRKAARGAGLSWGIAEEAGKATRWLEARGLPGVLALAGYLQDADGVAWEHTIPTDPGQSVWASEADQLSPLAAGSALCDLGLNGDLQFQNLHWPLLVLPYVAWASDTASISWSGVGFGWADGTLQMNAQGGDAMLVGQVDHAQVTRTPHPGTACPVQNRAALPDAARDILLGFASRTYAPETDASRLSGAGAGLVDRD